MQEKKIRPFGLRDKLGYLFGDFGNDFTFILSSSFLLKFYTDVMGVEAAVVGTVMMFARFADAFTDVTMGRLCDRSPYTKNGKFKPWIRRMCIPAALSSFMIYQSSLASLPTEAKVIYLFVTYILWGSVFYTSVNIPYGSMASAISGSPEDRQSLSVFRSVGGMLAGGAVSVGVPTLVYEELMSAEGEKISVMNGERFTLVAGVFSVLAVVCHLLCYYLTTERVCTKTDAETAAKNSTLTMLKNAVNNRALVSIIAASVVMLLGQLTMQQMVNYVFPDYYGNGKMQGVATLAMTGGMLVAAAVAKPLARRFGKAEISAVSSLLAGMSSLTVYFVRPESVWVYIGFQSVSWLGLGVFSMVSWALITDVIDYSELKNGVREDGSVYALYSFARKLGQAASSGISGALLSFIGYNESAAGQGLSQSQGVKEGIFGAACLVPAVSFIALSLILWLWYPLKKKQVEENAAKLRSLHESGEN